MSRTIKTVYVVHHSHTDIGYTDLQERVVQGQVNYIRSALRILDHFGLTEYFDGVGGADLEETRTKKADVIRYLLERENIPSAEGKERTRILMVGDREHDVLGAAQAGLDCVGVLYGYGSRQELEESGAWAIAESVEELTELLME